ncbi:MAG: hypothetical protein ACI9HK_003734 [Pirellulaceae bacterium]|jgi:hypothetical protein
MPSDMQTIPDCAQSLIASRQPRRRYARALWLPMALLLSGFVFPTVTWAQETGAQETGSQETGSKETGSQETGSKETGSKETGSSTSRQAREAAIRAIPFKELTKETQQKLWKVVSNPSMYRRMPTEVIDCDPQMHLFLVRYPEVIVSIWEMMQISSVDLVRTGKYTFEADDGAGTTADIELVYGTDDMHIYFAKGSYEGNLFRSTLDGDCVVMLRSTRGRQQNGRPAISNQMDVFVRIDNSALDLVTKTLSPLVGKTADYNFRETTRFVGRISHEAERDGMGVEQMANRLPNLAPTVRTAFGNVAVSVYERGKLGGGQIVNTTPVPHENQRLAITTAPIERRSVDGQLPEGQSIQSQPAVDNQTPVPIRPSNLRTTDNTTPPRRSGPVMRR